MKAQRCKNSEKRLIRLIRDKCAGAPYDVELYVNTMDRMMKQAYKYLGHKGAAFMGLDLQTFMDYCWSRLEDDRLVYKLADLSFKNNSHFLHYVRRVFENLLREKAGELSPGFRARQKQMERVLKPLCLPSCKRFCNCWRLKEFAGKPCSPASLERLNQAASPIPIPRPKATKSMDTRYPPISDNDMARFLHTVLLSVGGMATHRDMLAMITEQFDLFAVHVEQEPEERDSVGFRGSDEILLGPDHEAMAKEFVVGMNRDMIDIHYYRIAKDYTIAQTARAMNRSIGTVHNRERSYRQYIAQYFARAEGPMPTEEMNAIMMLVTEHVIAIKETS